MTYCAEYPNCDCLSNVWETIGSLDLQIIELKIQIEKIREEMNKESKTKMKKVMHEFKEGKLHSGSKMGALVTNPKQAVAIGYSESKRAKKKK